MATSERISDRPCANQGAQGHAREFVVGRLVHEDDRQDRGAAGLMDIRDRGLDRVTRRDDVVDDQHFLALRRGVVRGKGTAFAVPLLAGPVDDELFPQLFADQCREGNPVDCDADDRIRVHLPFLELLEGDVRHRRGHEPDAVPVHANGPPTDLHVFRRLSSLDPARQEPRDGLRGQVQLVRDLLLGEAFLLVLHGPLRDRVHVFHPFSNSAAHDARRRISRYRADARSVPEPAMSVYNPTFLSRPSSLTLWSKISRMYVIGSEPEYRIVSWKSLSEYAFPSRFFTSLRSSMMRYLPIRYDSWYAGLYVYRFTSATAPGRSMPASRTRRSTASSNVILPECKSTSIRIRQARQIWSRSCTSFVFGSELNPASFIMSSQ